MVQVGVDLGMKHRRSVALLVETSNAYSRGLLEGIIAYNKQHSNWSMFIAEQERGADLLVGYANGVVMALLHESKQTILRRQLRKLAFPSST